MERRQFIAGSAIAALSISTLPIAAASVSVDRAEWERAVQRYIDAEATADRHYKQVWLPLAEKAERAEIAAGLDRKRAGYWDRRKDYMKANPRLYFDLGEAGTANERLSEGAADAFSNAMRTPAPDLPAIRWKLEQFRDHIGGLDCYSADFVEQTFADIARLIPQGR